MNIFMLDILSEREKERRHLFVDFVRILSVNVRKDGYACQHRQSLMQGRHKVTGSHGCQTISSLFYGL